MRRESTLLTMRQMPQASCAGPHLAVNTALPQRVETPTLAERGLLCIIGAPCIPILLE